MQLGGVKKSALDNTSSLADALAAEFEEDAEEVGDAWGDGDLMDVNADGDDWSEFQDAILLIGTVLLKRQRVQAPLRLRRHPSQYSRQSEKSGYHARPTVDRMERRPQCLVSTPVQPGERQSYAEGF